MAYQIENFDFNAHIERIINFATEVEYGKITILTGPNGYGKSLLRKLLMVEGPDGKEYKAASISMAQRTNKNHDFDALGSLMMDPADDATSNHTAYIISCLFKSTDDRYLVLDEPEIGMVRK